MLEFVLLQRDGATVSRCLSMPGRNKVIVRAVSFDNNNKQHVSNEASGGGMYYLSISLCLIHGNVDMRNMD